MTRDKVIRRAAKEVLRIYGQHIRLPWIQNIISISLDSLNPGDDLGNGLVVAEKDEHELQKIFRNLADKQEPLGEEFQRVMDENIEELYEK